MSGFFSGGGIGFFFPLAFLLMLGIFLFAVIQALRQWNRNNHAPRLTVEATVMAKRQNVHHHSNGAGHGTHTSTSYYATFQVPGGDRVELHVSGMEYGMLAEGDQGLLSFQGTRYLGFARH